MVSATMPWGKHRGRSLDQLPRGYLRWLMGCDDLDGWLRSGVKAELRRRGERYVPAQQVLADLEETVTELITSAPNLGHEVCGLVTDHLLDAFEQIRQRYGITAETEMVIVPATRHLDSWRGGRDESE